MDVVVDYIRSSSEKVADLLIVSPCARSMAVLNWLGVSEFINDLCVTCLKLPLNTQLKSLGCQLQIHSENQICRCREAMKTCSVEADRAFP